MKAITRLLTGFVIVLPVLALILSIATSSGQSEASADERRLWRMDQMARAARCAYVVKGEAPNSPAEIAELVTRQPLPFGPGPCQSYNSPEIGSWRDDLRSELTGQASQLRRLDSEHIGICETFDTAAGATTMIGDGHIFLVIETPELAVPHEAGLSCFRIDVRPDHP
jgi:hypothetical protein